MNTRASALLASSQIRLAERHPSASPHDSAPVTTDTRAVSVSMRVRAYVCASLLCMRVVRVCGFACGCVRVVNLHDCLDQCALGPARVLSRGLELTHQLQGTGPARAACAPDK